MGEAGGYWGLGGHRPPEEGEVVGYGGRVMVMGDALVTGDAMVTGTGEHGCRSGHR